MSSTDPRRRPWLVSVVVCILMVGAASRSQATSSGITSNLLPPVTACNACHGPGTTPAVALTGPATVAPAATNIYSLQITNPVGQASGGFNVAATSPAAPAPAGTFSKGGPDSTLTRLAINGTNNRTEMTHSARKMSTVGFTTFSFQWTAPASFSSVVFTGWGNAVNGDGSAVGDQAASATLTIFSSVGGGPCTGGGECLTGFCVDGVCCTTGSCPGGQVCNVPGANGVCMVPPTATPTSTPTPTPTTAAHDAVVLAVKPVNVTIPTTKPTVVQKVRVKVRNADPSTQKTPVPVTLSASTDCPAGVTVGLPDFTPLTPLTADQTALLAGGKTKTAVVPVTIDSALITSHNTKAPFRCHLTFTVAVGVPNLDPTAGNNGVTTELNTIDKHDPLLPDLHESVLKSINPMTVTIGKLAVLPVIKKAHPIVVNADVETLSDGIALAVTATDCPGGVVGDPDFVPANMTADPGALVKGGLSKTATWPLTFDMASFTTPNPLSPVRCTATLTATGPNNPEVGPNLDPTNNTTTLVIDVVDKHDVP